MTDVATGCHAYDCRRITFEVTRWGPYILVQFFNLITFLDDIAFLKDAV